MPFLSDSPTASSYVAPRRVDSNVLQPQFVRGFQLGASFGYGSVSEIDDPESNRGVDD